jgi:tetratricopeptide (TPR) repeat protein
LLKSKRALLHAQIAEALQNAFAERVANEPELLAHHYTQAGNPTAAIPLWRKAGELALARMALQETVGHFRKGLALLDQLPRSAERDETELSIRDQLTAAWIGLRGWAAPEVAANASIILELAKRQDNRQSLYGALFGMWVNPQAEGRVAEALGLAERLLAEGKQAEDIDLQISGHATIMNSLFNVGRLIEAREQGERVLALNDPERNERGAQLTGHDANSVVGVYSAHWTWMLGYPDRAAQLSDETIAHARRMGRPFNLGWALTYSTFAFDYRGEPERLLAHVGEADRLGREQSIPFLYQVLVPTAEGLAQLRGGQLSASISLLRGCLESWNGLGAHLGVPYVKSGLAEALALQGDLDAALRLIDECLEQIERPGWQERSHLAEILRLKGWMLMHQGRPEEGETQLRASIAWARQQQAKSWELRSSTTLAELLAERGQRHAARQLLAPIYHWFTEGFETRDLIAARKLLETLG